MILRERVIIPFLTIDNLGKDIIVPGSKTDINASVFPLLLTMNDKIIKNN